MPLTTHNNNNMQQACSETAKSLADVAGASKSTGLAALFAGLKRLLPLPLK